MLRIAGYYLSKPYQYTNPQLFRNTLYIIREYNKGYVIDQTNKDRLSFSSLLRELRRYTFSIADIVITTLFNTADFKLYSTFQLILIFYNKAKKAIKADSQSLLIRYLYARGVILVDSSY